MIKYEVDVVAALTEDKLGVQVNKVIEDRQLGSYELTPPLAFAMIETVDEGDLFCAMLTFRWLDEENNPKAS